MSQFQVYLRGPVLALVLYLLSVLPATAQRIKLLQLEQKGTPKEGYFGLTNSAGDQRYVAHDSLVTTIITANGHWYLNGFDDAFGSTTISPGETVAFTGSDGSFRGIVAGLASSGSNTLFIDGTALQWNLGANGSYTTIGNVQGSSESVNFVGSGIVSTSRSTNTITISATEVDGSTSNELDTWDLGANASYTTISNGEQVNFVGSSGVTTSRTGNTITITGSSSLSGSGTTNYVTKWTSSTTLGNSAIQDNGSTVSIGGTLDASYELFIADGHIKIGDAAGELNKIYFGDGTFVYVGEGGADDRLYLQGTTMSINIGGSLGTSGYVLTSNGTTASWQPVSTAATDLTFTGASSPYTLNSSTGTDVTFASGGIVSLSRSVNQLTISATEVDGSTSNELDTWDLGANASYTTISNAEQVNFVGAGIASTSRSTNTITITATEVDGSVTNEAQTWSNSGTTSYTGTLSTAGGAGGGSFTIAAGSNVTVSHSAGTVTIASTAGATDLTFTGASSPYTLNSSTGTDVTFASGGIVSLSRSTNELTISATEVDGSVTNEAQTWSNSGTTSYTGTLSTAGGAGGGSFTIAAGSNVSVSHSAGTVTIAASFTEVDGSTSNELDTWDLGANASYTTISNGEQVNFVGAGIASTSRSTNTITITATEVDGSVTNEAQTWSNSGTTSYTGTLSPAGGAGGGSFTIAAGSNVSVSHSTGTVTIAASFTEVDGSTSNELDTWDLGANASYTTISNGEQVNFVGAGIASTSRSTNTITITATEVDGSVTNEAQTWTNSGTTSYVGTLSTAGGAGGGSFEIEAGSNVSISHSGGLVQISASFTEVDGSNTNELDTWDLGANASYTTISNAEQVNFVGAGIASTSRSTNTITITATEVDGSVTNEAQTWTNSGTTSYVGTLSTAGGAGGGSFTIAAGSNVTVSHSAGTVTIASTAGATDLTFTGTGPFTLNSSTGTDVTFTEGANIDITRTSNDLSFKATPAGSNTYVQYNSSGSFGSDVEFSFNATTDVLTAGNYIVGDWVGTSPNGSVIFSNSNGQLDNTNNYTGGWNYFSTTRGGFLGDFYIGSAEATYDNFYMPVYSLTGDGSGGGLGSLGAEGAIITEWSSSTSATIPDGTVYAAGSETHSSITLTLGSSPAGRVVYIVNLHDSNNLTVAAGSTINGEATLTLGPNDGGLFLCVTASGTWWKF